MQRKKPIVLSLCDLTGIASQPWEDDGRFDVIRVDVQTGGNVITDTIEDTLGAGRTFDDVVVVLAQPPCTHFTSSGARWWAGKGEEAIVEGMGVVDACLRWVALARSAVLVLENPVGRLPQ